MADFNGGNYPPRQKTILDDRKLTLYAPNPNNGRASLRWAMAGCNPRITVWSGMESDKDNGKSEAKMDLKTFMAFLVILEETIDAAKLTPAGEARGVQIAMGFFKDGRVNHISDLHVGQDKEGVIYISVVAKNGNTPVKFPFVTEEYHNFRHRGGEEFSKAEASAVMAKGYLKLLQSIVPILSERNWKEPEPRPNNGGNRSGGGAGRGNYNGGGGGNRSGGGGSYQRPAEDSLDDEIPDF